MAAPLPADTPSHQGTTAARPLRSLPGGPQSDSIMTGSTLDLVALLRASEHPHLHSGGSDCGGGATAKGGGSAAAAAGATAASAAATTAAAGVVGAAGAAGAVGHHSPVAAGGGIVPPRPSRPPPASPANRVSRPLTAGAKGPKGALPADAEDDERLFSYLIQAPPPSKAALFPSHVHHQHTGHPSAGVDAEPAGVAVAAMTVATCRRCPRR